MPLLVYHSRKDTRADMAAVDRQRGCRPYDDVGDDGGDVGDVGDGVGGGGEGDDDAGNGGGDGLLWLRRARPRRGCS